ncbi:MAG: polysaccharide lyase family 7 protein, partial [Planctomycetaceae bacterium]|nr:polysaccharide lyase family 7 protein [Planctomycetaceae bacterium]
TPAEILDLSNWRLTLPIDTKHPGSPDEVEQPELSTYFDHRYFFPHESGQAIVFRAHCGGGTTKGSRFPRCELREMEAAGTERAEWNTNGKEIHVLQMDVAITATPARKQHVVCVQIHDAEDDLMMVRLEGKKLFIERNQVGDVPLDNEYHLGDRFRFKIEAGKGTVRVWHQEELKMTWLISRKGCYFKAGCYTQSNPEKGDASESFGEVVIYNLQLEHLKPDPSID